MQQCSKSWGKKRLLTQMPIPNRKVNLTPSRLSLGRDLLLPSHRSLSTLFFVVPEKHTELTPACFTMIFFLPRRWVLTPAKHPAASVTLPSLKKGRWKDRNKSRETAKSCLSIPNIKQASRQHFLEELALNQAEDFCRWMEASSPQPFPAALSISATDTRRSHSREKPWYNSSKHPQLLRQPVPVYLTMKQGWFL